ncbi:MAG: PspC family transcriptional regulator [Cytophagaceae bacterium]
MKFLKSFIETKAFGVFTYWGERWGISIEDIRVYFIYTSFFTFGSPIILYLIAAFVMNIHKHLRRSRKPVWDF